jgi:hypothetical protein
MTAVVGRPCPVRPQRRHTTRRIARPERKCPARRTERLYA